MKSAVRIIAALGCVLCSLPSVAQGTEMADGMRSEGKIYVVVTIVLVVLAGLIGYLFAIDRKISRLENEKGEKRLVSGHVV